MTEKNKTPRSARRAFGRPLRGSRSPGNKKTVVGGSEPMSSIEKVKEMNKNLPKDAGGKYTLKRSIRNPNGRIEFKPNITPKPGFRYGGKVKKMKGKK